MREELKNNVSIDHYNESKDLILTFDSDYLESVLSRFIEWRFKLEGDILDTKGLVRSIKDTFNIELLKDVFELTHDYQVEVYFQNKTHRISRDYYLELILKKQ
tara:strand:+ start:347 stop:655 length:309 start_codon:yes stop_codon:yes gene_type:complete